MENSFALASDTEMDIVDHNKYYPTTFSFNGHKEQY